METSSSNTSPYERETEPLLLIISGPSGVGKDALVKRMKETGYPFSFVITATDRPPRPGEVDGRDYCFYSTVEFERMIAEGEMLEHSVVYGQHKGIPRAHVCRALEAGLDVIMRLDVQGARKVKGILPVAITVFLLPESEEELQSRLLDRRSESEEALQRRRETLQEELACIPEFDYVVMNRDNLLDEAVEDVKAILRAEHCRTEPRKVCL
ncbi:MAG: guanylate kinase [Anaerolineae bacterium]|jgi:guanylate kinase|nr:guanylate kinase [Anaerolineae bacterium]